MATELNAWIGLNDEGKPYFESTSDECGDCKTLDVFKARAEAAERFSRIAKARLVYEEIENTRGFRR